MLKDLLQTKYFQLLRIIYLQIILFFVYIPILVLWGLPISFMAIIGNIIFLPFLSLFLILSCLLFLTELCLIPNQALVNLFTIYSNSWLYLLNYGKSSWLFGIPCQSNYLFVPFIIAAPILFLFLKNKSLHSKIIISAIVLLSAIFILKNAQKVPSQLVIPTKNKTLTVYYQKNKLSIIIPRLRLEKNGIIPWFVYEIQPYLYKTFGSAYVNTIVLMNPTENITNLFLKNKGLIEYRTLIITKTSYKNRITNTTFATPTTNS